jgi:hypothetical protein
MRARRQDCGRVSLTAMERDWRERLGATEDVCARWHLMSDAERRPFRERERAELDAYLADVERALRGAS